MSWKVNGSYFESCNCEVACPCVFLNNPTEDECTAIVAWHIDAGNFDNIGLDDLNVAFAVHAPGNMADGNWKVAVYLDDRADDRQTEALTRIFSGQAGGHPERLAAFVGEVLGVASVPIRYQCEGRHCSLTIPDIAEVAIQAIEGQEGREVTISNHPLCIAPGEPAVTARSEQLTYRGQGMRWELSGKNGFYSPFQYAS